MDMKHIKEAVRAYESLLEEEDRARLAFFSDIWAVQAQCQEEFGDTLPAYGLPDPDELTACYHSKQPVFLLHPCPIDGAALAATAARIAAVMEEGADYPPEISRGLAAIDWDDLFARCGTDEAGRDPSEWLIDVEVALGGGDGDGEGEPAPRDYVARLGALAASLALKIQLEDPAAHVIDALDKGAGEPHALLCPICGSSPMMAHVGGPTSSDGRGRLLVCPQCGAVWEFERIRCARCGTKHESALHYYHIEGDDAHRIATCDECGGYIRTLFSERDLLPVAYEVEDVVMARLDAMAARALESPSARI